MDNSIKNCIKKVFMLALCFIMFLQNVVYCKYEGVEVDKPVAEMEKEHNSEATIIYQNNYKEFSPINPVPIGVDIDEYNSVNNFNIDLKTLETRIKYFSPKYLDIKGNAQSSYWMAFNVMGGSVENMANLRDLGKEEYKKNADDYKDLLSDARAELNKLNSIKDKDVTTQKRIAALKTVYIPLYEQAYSSYRYYTTLANTTVSSTMASLRYSSKLETIANVDKNNSVTYAREEICKSLTSAILSYFQLSTYMDILDKQVKLYKDMYDISYKNYELGLVTSLEVSEALNSYEVAKSTYKSTKTSYDFVKQSIALNLGYSLDDIDKLNFIEPEIDAEYINNINLDNDRERAYNSNSAYKSVVLENKDKIYPGSTGEVLFHFRQDMIRDKILVKFEQVYNALYASKLSYKASTYLEEIIDINTGANIRKKNNNLVSDVEYDGLCIQNLANILEVKQAKYDLITKSYDYYYAALGHLDV